MVKSEVTMPAVNDHLKFPLVRSSEIPPLPVMNDVLRGAPEIGPPRDRLS
jgi:hypothetical protein